MGLNDTDFIISYFGALDRISDIQPLLETVEQSKHITLLIGGRGMLEGIIKQAAEKTPNIRWLGWIPTSEIHYTHIFQQQYIIS